MKIEFLRGYRGWSTKEQYYEPDTVGEFQQETCDYLISLGVAKYLEEVPEPEISEATPQAEKLAAEHNIDLLKVAGSGSFGRILVTDVKALIDD